jgi:hypothetical protein
MQQAKIMTLFSDINNKVALKFTVPFHTHADIILSLHSLFEKLIVAHLVTDRLIPGRRSTNAKVHLLLFSTGGKPDILP